MRGGREAFDGKEAWPTCLARDGEERVGDGAGNVWSTETLWWCGKGRGGEGVGAMGNERLMNCNFQGEYITVFVCVCVCAFQYFQFLYLVVFLCIKYDKINVSSLCEL